MIVHKFSIGVNDLSDDFVWDPKAKKIFVDYYRAIRDIKTLNNVQLMGEGDITLQQIGAEDRGTANSVMREHTSQINPHGQYLLANALPITKFINGNEFPNQNMNGVVVWSKTVRTPESSPNNLVVHVTVDGNESSPAIFSQIILPLAMTINPVGAINATHLMGCYEIKANQKTIRFSNVKGGISILGGAGLQAGDAGVEVRVVVIGIPA